MPPTATSSDIRYLPLGLRSASTGTRLPMRVKSSSASGTRASCAIASRCSTAFVDPPSAMTAVIAFSKASRVRIREGVIPRSSSRTTAAPASLQSSRFASETASCAELFGRLMPSASIADAIVFAVYMPPQEPAPGIALRSISARPASSRSPFACRPTASKTLTMSRRPAPGPDRAAVDEHRGPVEAGDRHHAAGHVLVAAADRDQAVESLRAGDGLDRVGDHFARDQRIAHARRAHRDAVRHGDRVEQDVAAAGLPHAPAGGFRQLADVQVAGRHPAPGRGHADLRAEEVLVRKADRAQHRAVRRALCAVDDAARVLARIVARHDGPSCRMPAAVDKPGSAPG